VIWCCLEGVSCICASNWFLFCLSVIRSFRYSTYLKRSTFCTQFVCSWCLAYSCMYISRSLSYDRSIASAKARSPQCGIVLLLPISRILAFPEGHTVAAYIFFLIFPSLLSFPLFFPSISCSRRQFLHKMWPIQWAFLIFIVCRMYRCSLTDCNTSSFLTQSAQLVFSILLQHNIS